MENFPLTALLNLVNSVFIGVCCIVIWLKRKSLRWEKRVTNLFYGSFIFSFICFFLVSLPAIFVFDPIAIQIILTLSDVSIMFIAGFLLAIPLVIFFQKDKLVKIILGSVAAFSLFFVTYNLVFLEPAIPVVTGQFIDWNSSTNLVLSLVVWGFTSIALLTFILLFFVKGCFNQNKFIRIRSRLFTIGYSLVLFGWIIVIISDLKYPEYSFPLSALGSFLFNLGGLSLLFAVILKKHPAD